MANGAKDAWDKVEVVTAVIGSLLLPIVIFVVGNIYIPTSSKKLRQLDLLNRKMLMPHNVMLIELQHY